MRYNEIGRSMVEMLGALVIMGILAIGAVAGFRYAMDRQKANQLYQDVKLAYMSIASNGPYDWTQTEFDSPTNFVLFVRQDKAKGNFVLAEAIPDTICDMILDMTEGSEEVVLYTPMNELIDCSAETQDIVFAFGDGRPPLIPCEGIDECPDSYNSYCSDEEGVCMVCDLGQRKNDFGTGCVDLCSDRDDTYTETCTSEEEGLNWCCPFDSVCSGVAGKCIDASKVCVYDMKETKATEMYYTATCSYTMKATTATEMYYTATCGYNLQQTTDADGNINVSFSKIGNSCPSNHYCRLTWTAQTWTGTAPTGFANDYVGDMFGVCVPMSATSGNAQPVYPSSENLMSRKTDCPDGQYCNLRWTTTENNCANASIPNDYVGLLYGGCVDLNKVNTATCPGSIPGVMVP